MIRPPLPNPTVETLTGYSGSGTKWADLGAVGMATYKGACGADCGCFEDRGLCPWGQRESGPIGLLGRFTAWQSMGNDWLVFPFS